MNGAKDFDGRVVVVTGASGGVGRATARMFGARGARVALLARGEVGLEAAAREVFEAGGRPLPLVVDMASYDEVERAATRIEDELGPIRVWVNVAFSTVFAEFTDVSPAEFLRATQVTYLGFVHGTRAALDRMLPRDEGVIVQTGSALAKRGIPLQSVYCASKHAIQGLYESLRCELLHRRSNVRMTMVHLPALNTPQFDWVLSRLPHRAQPVPPIYQPEVAAGALVHAAAHPRRREYWVGASTVATLLANRVVPGLLDRYLAWNGYASQQTKTLRDPDEPVNLWEPADGGGGKDFGAHGRFDARAHPRSLQWWASRHRLALSAAGTAVLAAAVLTGTRRKGTPSSPSSCRSCGRR